MKRDEEKVSTRLKRERTKEQESKVCDRKTKSGNWAEQQRKGGRHANKVL